MLVFRTTNQIASVDKPLIFDFDSSLPCVLLPDSKILFKAGGPCILALRLYWRNYPPTLQGPHHRPLPLHISFARDHFLQHEVWGSGGHLGGLG